MAEQVNRPHHKSKDKDKKNKDRHAGQQNPKAHTFTTPGRFKRQAARAHDVREKRFHVPLVDRLPEEAPPLVVGVVGPPQVGKTTLIKSLIRRYTKQTLSSPTGPLTVVTSKRRRLTFIECPADSLASMIDVAKVVDIVLLMIDGKYGFEMETMEFLNVLSASGMPGNVFGILTKLDLFKKQDTLRTQKKRLKHRFWTELYQGAKLFYLSGIVNGRYPDREILNLSRFLSVMKNPRPLVWRNSHPYCLADRFLDITPPTDMEANPKCDRTIALYGYLRGTNFAAQGARVHVPGVGDLSVAAIETLPDPCPTPYITQAMEKTTGKPNRRRLGEKQKVLFAPMSDVGGVLVDKDAVYIDVKTSTFDRNAGDAQDRGLGEQLVLGLQGERRAFDRKDTGVRLFGNASAVDGVDDVHDDDESLGTGSRRPAALTEDPTENDLSDSDMDSENGVIADGSSDSDSMMGDQDEPDSHMARGRQLPALGDISGDRKVNGDIVFADSDSEMSFDDDDEDPQIDMGDADDDFPEDEEDNGALQWKENLANKARALYGHQTQGRLADLSKLIYDLSLTPRQAIAKWKGEEEEQSEAAAEDDGEDGDDFFKKKTASRDEETTDDRMMPLYDLKQLEAKWNNPENIKALRRRFIATKPRKTGGQDSDDSAENGDFDGFDESQDEGDGEFEDLETGETHSGFSAANQKATLDAEREKNAKRKEELKLRFEEEDRDGFANDKTNARRDQTNGEDAEFGEDEWYDAQKAKIQKQLDINRSEFADMDEQSRVRVEGYRAGSYARIVLSQVPYEFAAFFNPRFPLVIGGLNPTEDRFGFVQVRIKRHRWHQKILKTNDPLIFSLGWRRFQTLPIYSISDSRTRNRMLKYTPEHMHCFGTFYGPLIAPNTGFCCVQSFSNTNPGFRVAATGVVLNVDEGVEIVKKLKLIGHPHKVYKNTAIIKDMFGSDLEIAKFKSANLRTVSGIRGMIKGTAGHQYPEGYVRAGFEDKILMSDIVFLSTWRAVTPQEFYTPVTNLLMGPSKQKPAADPAADDWEDVNEPHPDDNNDTPAGAPDPATPADWSGMRLTSQVRGALALPTPHNRDSTYRSIERPARHFNPLRVPRKLQADLPFKSQIAAMAPQRRPTYLQRRAVVLGGDEKRARDLLQKVMTLRNEKVAKRAAAQERRKEPYRRRVAEEAEKKTEREKRERDEYWRKEGRKVAKRGAAAAGEGQGGRGGKKRKR